MSQFSIFQKKEIDLGSECYGRRRPNLRLLKNSPNSCKQDFAYACQTRVKDNGESRVG